MTQLLHRRAFLSTSAAALATPLWGRAIVAKEPLFKISLAQWSLHRAYQARELDPLYFAKTAKNDYQIDAIEYVNQFYKRNKNDKNYATELKKVADDNGVRSVLIMCDGEGALGDPDATQRAKAVENHRKWVEWAKILGCHSIRVNAQSSGSYDEQIKLAADGLRKLTELAEPYGIAVIVENHGGLSSNGEWLAKVMTTVNHKNCGTLPDFGNFRIGKGANGQEEWYDRYKGVDELMPFAKGVSAKSYDFDESGNDTRTDYRKMLDIVVNKHKYRGYIGIEYEGKNLPEPEGIRATKKLLETVRSEMERGSAGS
jgi:sugar phosphate isomerase/epimerase